METMSCQELTPWFKSKDRPSLPTDIKITFETDMTKSSCHPKAEGNLLSMQAYVQLLKIATKPISLGLLPLL